MLDILPENEDNMILDGAVKDVWFKTFRDLPAIDTIETLTTEEKLSSLIDAVQTR